MGCSSSNARDAGVSEQIRRELVKVSKSIGSLGVVGRFHKLPVQLEDHYTVTKEVLGHGQGGAVFLATSKETGRKFAVKTLKTCKLPARLKKRLVNEISIMLAMDHPNIATLIDAYESEEEIYLVTECMDGGNLCKLAMKEQLTESVAAEMVKQMLLAVNYLHSRSVVHRDIKLDNFLIESEGGSHLKLIDFGVSKRIAQNQIMGTTTCTGTLAYTAPEVLENWYDNKCDIWSLAVITSVLLVGYMPFYGNEQQIAAMIRQSTPMNNGPKERWSGISEEAKDLVRKMFRRSPIDRISADQALKHPWITGARATVNPAVPLDSNLDATACLQQFARASEFRRACVRMMIWSFPSEEQAQIRDAFVYLDTESKGVVSIDTIAGKLCLSDKSEIQKVFGKEMRYSDFVAVMGCSRVADHTELVKEAFRRFDIGNSGLLTEKELQTALGDKFDCEAIMERFPDSQMSAAEFIAYLRSKKLVGMDDETFAAHAISISPQSFRSPTEFPLCETMDEI